MTTKWALILGSAAALFAAATPASQAAAKPCDQYTGKTIAANNLVRVFRPPVPKHADVYDSAKVCYRPSRRVSTLGDGNSLKSAAILRGGIQMSGHHLAYAIYDVGGQDSPEFGVYALDAATGHQDIYRTDVYSGLPVHPDRVTSIAVLPNGTIGWIVGATKSAPAQYAVHIAAAGKDQLVATGSDIGANSLAAGAAGFYWTRAGAPQLTPVP
jgi:hypothetical protein